MDQFLPGDISVMVLKYLALSGCEATAVTMIEEMPFLQFYVPKQPPGVSKSDFVRMLGRPSLTPSLNDVLNDYGHAKMLVTDIIEKQERSDSPLRPCDSLLTHLKLLSNALSDMKKRIDSTVPTVLTSQPRAVAEKAINTDPHVLFEPHNKVDAKATTDTGTQTVELPIIEIGSPGESVDVPLMFYNSLMSDSNLQQKLATAINQHLTDPCSSKNEVLQKVCSTAETDIDKFLGDLLKDMPPSSDIEPFSSLSCLIPEESQNPIFNDVERNLANLFQDAQCLIGEEPRVISTEPLIPTIQGSPVTGLVQELQDPLTSRQNNNTGILKAQASAITVNTADSNATNVKTKRIPKKRVALTPAHKTDVNPVFETVQTVEQAVSSEGRLYSVHTTVPVISDWQKLGRRPIAPKIPSPVKCSLPTPSKQITGIIAHNKPPLSVNKRKAKISTPVKLTPEKAKSSDLNFFLVYHDTPKAGTSSSGTPNNQMLDTSSDHKDMPVKEIPSNPPLVPFDFKNIQTSMEKQDQIPVSVKANSMVEVTPILEIPNFNLQSSGSIVQSVSPRMHRLIASAQKVRAISTQASLVRRSYSTPRKKKHVRSLLFTTPPSIKNKTAESPGSPSCRKITNGHGVSLVLPVKRKCLDAEDCQPKIKKRLQWLEDNTYKSTAFPDRNFTSTRVSERMLLSANKVLYTKKPVVGCEKASTEEKSKDETALTAVAARKDCSNIGVHPLQTKSAKHLPLSKILEETPFIAPNSSAIRIPSPVIVVDDISAKSSALDEPCMRSTSTNVSCNLPPLPLEIVITPLPPIPTSPAFSPPKMSARITSGQKLKPARPVVQGHSESKAKCPRKSKALINELFGSDDSIENDNTLPDKYNQSRKNEKMSHDASSEANLQKPEKPTKTRTSRQRQQKISPVSGDKTRRLCGVETSIHQISPTEKSSRKTPKAIDTSPKAKRGCRKSKRELDAAAAKIVANDAVPLGFNSAIHNSPKSKGTKIENSTIGPFESHKIINTASEVTAAQEIVNVPVITSKIETPLKNPIPVISFSILPPLGFPDPIPTKGSAMQTLLQGQSSSPLVTPMKNDSSVSISPPVTLPPTPGYLLNETDTDSNSTSGVFRMYSYNFIDSTPSKFLGPPPTPGRNLFRDERCDASLPALQHSLPNPEYRTSEHPLDLTSPVAPHRVTEPQQTSQSYETVVVSKVISSPEKIESPVAALAKKLAAWKAKAVKTNDGHFQVPRGAPKKASPAGSNLLKKESCKESVIQNKIQGDPNIKTKTPDVSKPVSNENGNGKAIKPNAEVSGTGMRFIVEGRAKKLSMSEQQTLLSLLEIGRGRGANNTITKISEDISKNEELPQARNLLKNVDLNHFLSNVVHKPKDKP